MQDRALANVLRKTADLYGGAARDTILFENFDKHLTELRLILDALPRAAGLLDLGGGVGVNLVCLRQLRHTGPLVLVDKLREYNAANHMGTAAKAIELLNAHDITIDQTDFWPDYRSSLAGGSFAVTTCFDVVEHLPGHPRRQLLELARLLHPGGVLLLGAPNASSLMKHVKLLLGQHPYSPFEDWIGEEYFAHIREYTAAEYRTLVTMSGLTAERTVRSAAIPRTRARNRYHRRKHGVLSPVSWALHLAYLVERAVPPLRHSVYVVARKPSQETRATS